MLRMSAGGRRDCEEDWNSENLCSLMLCMLQFCTGLLLCSELSMMTGWKDPGAAPG